MKIDPLIIYLDTQDYIRIFNDPEGAEVHKTLDRLLKFRDNGEIVIGYSWVTVFEFITKPSNEFREERVRRGRLIKEICGKNAFPYLTELKNDARFPNGGYWIPGRNGKIITASLFRSKISQMYKEAIAEHKGLNRAERRRLRTRSAMQEFLRKGIPEWGNRIEDYKGIPVSREIIESGIISRFIKGLCSDSEFEEKLNGWLSDPEEFSRIFYDYANKQNMIDEYFTPSLIKIESALGQVHDALRGFDEAAETLRGMRQNLIGNGIDKRTAKKLIKLPKRPSPDVSSIVNELEKVIGKGYAEHFGHYVSKAARKGYRFKRSDVLDLMQMCYVRECDLFRCDKAMADLFKDFAPFLGKLVDRFEDLPERIEKMLHVKDQER